jgi:hypothetical protein
MNLNQGLFRQYVEELQKHLFADMTLDDIINGLQESHRKRRFVAMYLLKDRDTFTSFLSKRHELGIDAVFNQIITTLLNKADSYPFIADWIELLDIKKDMVTKEPSSYEIREMMKDLKSFIFYCTKQELATSSV